MKKLLTILFITLALFAKGQSRLYDFVPGEYYHFVVNNSTGQPFEIDGTTSAVSGLTSGVKGGSSWTHDQYFLLADSSLRALGLNQDGELLNGNTTGTSTASTMATTDSAGNSIGKIIQVSGTSPIGPGTYGWGVAILNSLGQMYVGGCTIGGMWGGGTTGSPTPYMGAQTSTYWKKVNLPTGVVITQFAVCSIISAVDTAGELIVWGGNSGNYNSDYNLAQGTSSPNWNTPTKITLPTGWKAKYVTGGLDWNYVICDSSGTQRIGGWGRFMGMMSVGFGDAGGTGSVAYETPNANAFPEHVIKLDTAFNLPHPILKNADGTYQLVTNSSYTYVILTDSTLWGCGDNVMGAGGDGTEINFQTYSGVNGFAPGNWDQQVGERLYRKMRQIAVGKHNFAKIFPGMGLTYYIMIQDGNGFTYTCGRNKAGLMGNQIIACDEVAGGTNNNFPNFSDQTLLLQVNPFATPKVTMVEQYCLANPTYKTCGNSGCAFDTTIHPTISYHVTTSGRNLIRSWSGSSDANGIYRMYDTQTSGTALSIGITSASSSFNTDTIYNVPDGTYGFTGTVVGTESNVATMTASVTMGSTPAPAVTSFTPTSAATGTTVTLTGTNFTGATAVSFGGTAASSYTVVSATSITAVVAAGTTGSVSVTTANGTGTQTGFTYIPAPTITSFTPTSAASGATVTLNGTNFTGATSVSFGVSSAASFTVVSPTSITAVLGSGSTGTVSVITPGGTGTHSGFTYIPPPNVTSFTPTSDTTAGTVTITGTNFTGATSVSFGGTAATSFTVVSPTSITAIVGSGTSGSIQVGTPGGTSNLTGFTYTPPTAPSTPRTISIKKRKGHPIHYNLIY